jgi:hypothetical protein
MNNLTLYLNNVAIPAGKVLRWPEISEEISYDSNINIPDSYIVEIDNSNPLLYDPKYPSSILYGCQILKIPMSIYDSDMGQNIMRGWVKNIQTDSGTARMTVEATSQLSLLATNDVQIVKTGLSPAEILYQMITAPVTIGLPLPLIDPSYIDTSSYQYCASYQRARRITADINILKGGDSSKKFSDIIPELNKIGQMVVYSHFDKIYFWQYDNNKTPTHIISVVEAGSYRDYYSQDAAFKIKNSYSIAYINGANIAYATGKDMTSIQKYGESIFSIPSDRMNSTASADFNVGLDNETGAQNCGQAAMSRLNKPAFMCEFVLPYSYNYLKIGDILGLNFGIFSSTPVRVLSAAYDLSGNKIKYKTLFL